MDEFMHLQQVLERHHIPYHARDHRPAQGPLVIIAQGGVSILVCFDRTGAYARQAVADQQEDPEQHETPR